MAEPPANPKRALLQVAPELFLIGRTEWPANEVDTTQAGMIPLVRDHLGYLCDYDNRRLVLGHGSLIVVPGTGVAVLLWWHWFRSQEGFVQVNTAGFGFYPFFLGGRLDHPSYATFRSEHELFVAPLGPVERQAQTGGQA